MRLVSLASLILFAASPCLAGPRIHRGPTSPRSFRPRTSMPTKSLVRAPRISGIDPERATQIQAALVKVGYMTGETSGTWDSETEAAMGKLQADNGWQTKFVPDARAMIKLGLGPGSTPAPAAPAMNPADASESISQAAIPAN